MWRASAREQHVALLLSLLLRSAQAPSTAALSLLGMRHGASVRTFTPAAAASGTALSFDTVLVKVGDDGKYMPFKSPELIRKNTTALLEALADSRVFCERLKDVDWSDCTVSVVKGELPASKDVPDAADEAPSNLLELKGAKTLEQAAVMAGTGTRVFVRVQLPIPPIKRFDLLLNREDEDCDLQGFPYLFVVKSDDELDKIIMRNGGGSLVLEDLTGVVVNRLADIEDGATYRLIGGLADAVTRSYKTWTPTLC